MRKLFTISTIFTMIIGLGLCLVLAIQKNNYSASIIPVSSVSTNPLMEEIKKYADEHNIEPVDAVVDRVWKAIPGYNGLSIDSEKSYKKMNGRFQPKKLVYEEIPPKVHLKDLPPSPIYRGNPEKPMVALLINVAWGNEFIEPILETLENHQVKATFFFDGGWVSKNPDFAKLIFERHHEIGSHAYSHPDLQHSTEQKTREELTKTNNVLDEVLGIQPKWFAPPSGSFNEKTIEIAREFGMYTVLWTIDTVDWRNPATSEMVNRVVSKVEKGSMILMHPTKPTAEGLTEIIDGIKEKGYILGTVSDVMSESRVR